MFLQRGEAGMDGRSKTRNIRASERRPCPNRPLPSLPLCETQRLQLTSQICGQRSRAARQTWFTERQA